MKLSYKAIKTVLRSLNSGSTIKSACNNANISTVTYFSWANKYPKFKKLADKAIKSRINFVEDALFKTAVTGSVSAQRYFLNNRQSHRWKDEPITVNVEHKTAIFQQIHHHYSESKKIEHTNERDTIEVRDNTRDSLQVIE